MNITIQGKTAVFPDGSSFYDIAKAYQPEYPHDILLAKLGTKLYELHKKVPAQGGELQFITAADHIGQLAYQRSAILMMLKAFYRECEGVPGFGVIVDYTLGGGFYCYLKGDTEVTEELLQRVQQRMVSYRERRMPIVKRNISTTDAIQLFHDVGMVSKERLFHYRMTSRVNVYSLGNFVDYFYGFMVMDTGYIKHFSLVRYGSGFVLMLPTLQDPEHVADFVPLDKLYQVQKESAAWADSIDCGNVGALNDQIVRGATDNLILMQEAIFEKTVGNIAMQIAEQNKKLVMIAGPSSSGKTSFSRRLSIQLMALGLHPHPITVDNYFRDRKLAPIGPDGKKNFESIQCVDIEQFNEDMLRLLRGEQIELPVYNFISGKREYHGDFCRLSDRDVLVIEGIHCLNDEMSQALPKDARYKIYISSLTQINVDAHNRIPTTDGRLLRRIVRDNRTRGYSAKDTIAMWESVRKGEDENIFPYQETADVMVNSSMIYELPVLKLFAAPLLFQIRPQDPEYQEAKRLLKFLDYFLPISPELIPKNSIIREFIGGSCLDVG